ncbi:MAG: prepilin-type N-terminal cleavage/methylation domain-containing protein [Planctomycetota bacterium]
MNRCKTAQTMGGMSAPRRTCPGSLTPTRLCATALEQWYQSRDRKGAVLIEPRASARATRKSEVLGRAPIRMQRSGSFPAFSLIEMMIAIVILGLGMIMVATLFPVAWTRAKELSESTNLTTINDVSEATMKSLAFVCGPGKDGSMFAGDNTWYFDKNQGKDLLVAYSDTRVHVLNMENLLVSNLDVPGMRQIVSEQPWKTPGGAAYPYRLDGTKLAIDPLDYPEFAEQRLYVSARVSSESRVHPPIRTRANRDFAMPDVEWDELLDGRRFTWAVLHRLRKGVGPTNILAGGLRDQPNNVRLKNLDEAQAARSLRRDFDLYYVLLRRPQALTRYVQQDADPDYTPNPYDLPEKASIPYALPPENDVALPVPWRVHLLFRGPFTVRALTGPTNIPSEVEVNPLDFPTHAMLIDLFPPGAFFVDEISGNMYRVEKRRLAGLDNTQALLTLDREIFLEDIDLPIDDPRCESGHLSLDPCEQVRAVWVFPPPVKSTRKLNGEPIFEGQQPVVGINIRSFSVIPTS